MEYQLNDIIVTKKMHPCGSDEFRIVRLGADIKIKCMKCGHMIMLPRINLNKKIKKVVNDEKKED